jgi:murein DD-endopeptidase MepM/ murein hydrolase activator NlpD
MKYSVEQTSRLGKVPETLRRRSFLREALTAAATLTLLAVTIGFYLTSDYWLKSIYDEELQPIDDAYQMPEDIPVYVPIIVDLPGDPIWISLSSEVGAEQRRRTVTRPSDSEHPEIPEQAELLTDVMLSTSEQFITTIPASQQDFAFFQAQRARAPLPASPLSNGVTPSPSTPVPQQEAAPFDDPSAGWGETIDESEAALPEFRRTGIENNTSLALVRQQNVRFEPTRDHFVQVLFEQPLASVIREAGFSQEDADEAAQALEMMIGTDMVEGGHTVAMRGVRPDRETPDLRLMQLSAYAASRYLGTVARAGDSTFAAAADPWIRDDLLSRSMMGSVAVTGRRFRLLDAIYSAAARNNVPTEVIGEAIMYLSRGEDLNAFAEPNDRLVLLYSESERGPEGSGARVLYVSIQGRERSLRCYVFRQSDGNYGCASSTVAPRAIAEGMVTPVAGVLTSGFGPRRHPILGTVRPHNGVDWRAPAGTPIQAALDGEIVFQGDAGGYGNLVRIAHPGGMETRYAHMKRFADNQGVGARVRAGEVIGYVGTTGLSTGPHLHFELHQGGVAIDPLGTVVAAASDATAVESLVDNIIRVESAGNPRARNPLSTATGLGQFIESTWVRMMNTYRPDLAQTLSRAELLELRFDPTISREMVRNLAREGEAYLRSRGHHITAGRLYLSHFLGMEGAHRVLSTEGGMPLVDVLGTAVINANPFLRGKDVNYVVNWAEGKMRRRGSAPTQMVAAQQTAPASPELQQYQAMIDRILKAETEAL